MLNTQIFSMKTINQLTFPSLNTFLKRIIAEDIEIEKNVPVMMNIITSADMPYVEIPS